MTAIVREMRRAGLRDGGGGATAKRSWRLAAILLSRGNLRAGYIAKPRVSHYFFAPAFSPAQYFRILSAAAFLAAGDIRRRFRCGRVGDVAPPLGADAFASALIFAHRAF